MKKAFSLVVFALMITVFLFDIYICISGAIDVKDQLAELAAREAGGHELLGVGLDILVFGVVFVSAVGGIISFISYKIAQFKAMRIASAVIIPLFLLPIFISAIILAS